MAKDQIQKIIDILPQLTNFGIGIYDDGRKLSREEYKRKFDEEQATLLNSLDDFVKACSWLNQISKIKSINRHRTSYGLKHVAEKHMGYVTNGVFIAAAIHCGFKYKINDGSPNVMFNMSEKSIKEIEK